jgi:hypothetical protein
MPTRIFAAPAFLTAFLSLAFSVYFAAAGGNFLTDKLMNSALESAADAPAFLPLAKQAGVADGALFGGSNKPAGFEMGKKQVAASSGLNAPENAGLPALLPPPPPPPGGTTSFDFDGDGKADAARWKASSGEWRVQKSSDSSVVTQTLGAGGNLIAPADYDGDGKTDYAVFNSSTGGWTIKKSSNGAIQTISGFGQSGDKPVSGDYDGDGLADAAVWRPSNGTWYVRKSSDGTVISTQYGASTDVPVPGNYDGDAKMDYAVFRPSGGYWFVKLGASGSEIYGQWGTSIDVPVPADYDGDGKTDFAVFRPSTGIWYLYKSSSTTGEYIAQSWGNYGDQPLPADFDGDGKADLAVWRPTTGVWYYLKTDGTGYGSANLGVAGDFAVLSAYLKQLGGYVYSYDFARARLSPRNSAAGADLYSRNFGWGTSLINLPGRAGLDLSFGISYNSLVWTKDSTNNTIVFNADAANVAPGFRFGFPVIEPAYYDAQTEKFSYLMVAPSGARIEFRQTAASDVYETADSSYARLKISGATSPNDPAENLTLTVTTTDGAQSLYEWKNGAYRCQRITDRNGNYISINHDYAGLLQTVTDTLGRVVTVNYDYENSPVSITQTWKDNNGAGSNITRTWATFAYASKQITGTFSAGMTVVGPGDGYSIKVLDKITFGDAANNTGSINFFYNAYGQIWKIENRAKNNDLLSEVKTNLETPGTALSDCPRLSDTWTRVKDFNNDQYVKVTNALAAGQSYSVGGASGTGSLITVQMENHPHGLIQKIYVGETGWREGLPVVTEDWANGAGGAERKRWTWTNWTQDDANAALIQHPRVTETKVGDAANTKRTTVDYYLQAGTNIADYGLVKEVKVYAADQTTVWKKISTEYNLDTAYTSRRIIGLPSLTEAWGWNQETNQLEKVSRLTYGYDEENFSQEANQNIASAIQRDNANFGAGFIVGRGNLTSVTRHDVTGQTSPVTSKTRYDIAGSVVARLDPLNRKTRIEYADSFNDGINNRNAFAYPTKLFDAAGNFSEAKYRFDTGANVWAQSPAPAGSTTGKTSERIFDALGRLQKETILNTGAYTRYEYPTNGVQFKVYATITDTNNNGAEAADEVLSETWTDGAGRVLRARKPHAFDAVGNPTTWSASLVEYDLLGQVKRSSVPTEVSVNESTNGWTPAGDDAVRGWLWTHQKYDWRGRVTRIINTDGADSPTLNDSDQLFSYEGCGCAGGQVTTVQGELVPRDDLPTQNARRTQKIYEDILGRVYKTEVFKWDGALYSSTLSQFNGRDQALNVVQTDHAQNPVVTQTATMTYDGHGRLKTRHRPEQDANKNTVYN